MPARRKPGRRRNRQGSRGRGAGAVPSPRAAGRARFETQPGPVPLPEVAAVGGGGDGPGVAPEGRRFGSTAGAGSLGSSGVWTLGALLEVFLLGRSWNLVRSDQKMGSALHRTVEIGNGL